MLHCPSLLTQVRDDPHAESANPLARQVRREASQFGDYFRAPREVRVIAENPKQGREILRFL
jgi:hypothetical protein